MHELIEKAEHIAEQLKQHRETIAVAEFSTGGLISASLLAVPGASAYFLGGAVVYTRQARRSLMSIPDAAMSGIRSASEPYALLLANRIREQHGSTWGLSETGAAGPTGNRYGDPAGTCLHRDRRTIAERSHDKNRKLGPSGQHARLRSNGNGRLAEDPQWSSALTRLQADEAVEGRRIGRTARPRGRDARWPRAP